MADIEKSNEFADVQSRLSSIDVSGLTEDKKDYKGNSKTYLSWSYAWGELIKNYPDAEYEIERFGEERLPYLKTKEGYMVFTKVTICGHTREMWLPVQDANFETMKEEPYEIVRKSGNVVTIAAADMSDINKSIMRCLVKNIAMFGLGLNVYQGEDLPNVEDSKIVEPKKPTVCSVCGREIHAEGQYTADQIVAVTTKRYGKPMCFECSAKEKKEQQSKGE